jgi:hypothetical protein
MDASCDHALNEDNTVGQKSGEFPCGEDVTVMEGTIEGMRKGNRKMKNLGADGGVELSSFTKESDMRNLNKGAQRMEFISRNGKEQDNVGDIYEEQTVGTRWVLSMERDPLQSKGTGEYPVCGLDFSTEI